MPSKSPEQARLMRAVAHGWKPDRIKGPTRAVAQEFVDADKRRGKVEGYQFGGMVPAIGTAYRAAMNRMPYRGVPPQRGGLTMGGGQGLTAPWQGPGPSPMDPGWGRGGGGRFGGPLRAMRQLMMQRRQPGGGGFGRYPGGSGPFVPPRGGDGLPPGIDPRAVAANPEGWARHQADPRFAAQQRLESQRRRLPGGSGPFVPPAIPGPHDLQDFSMGEGPGGRLEREGLARYDKMRSMPGRFPRPGPDPRTLRGSMAGAQNRFGALTQAGGPAGGASLGKITPSIPGRRIAPPPSRRIPVGGRGGRGRFGGRGGRGAFSRV